MWYQKSGNKYHAKSTEYGGVIYHSKKEAAYAQELDLRLYAGEFKAWKRQIPIELIVNGYKICRYYVDFEIEHHNGTIEWVEVKGWETDIFRIKRKLLEAIYDKEFNERTKIYTVVK